LVQIRPISF